ncbi:hypothetical protein [Cupriavidus taiwanensis]|uniref:DUF6630 domain-containing protein n=2 Tax=Cupriavidus taiwanensis TaxID=164546 RepID=B3RCZ0_CUPTR|nr:hypothetical protein [Cupriavidus taiwanensis]CAQ72765.1 conserved hypothetical protein [Cupriavidus taiwanensis LMG 19424]SOZ09021.1 conserved hypothetical protein [Cupriavidus taiwanensis]SOZ11262.1 conserved hypothetical protein [Cupriavidus taiwanensis]SOZ42614.1 conserved hypothetical protein [Cupriavidus taiwanensis]SPC20162.1 conserved hypothetical protein [Cupriavidus taiwanensis]
MATPLDDDTQDAIARFFALINLDDSAQTSAQLAMFEDALLDAEDDDTDGPELLWVIREVIDWQSGFFVDWKDAQSFIGCLNQLCERVDLELDWGTDDPEDEAFLESTSVPELMELAHNQLRVAGYTLWNWDTGGDAYAGWITRSEDDEEMLELAEILRFEVRPADQPY